MLKSNLAPSHYGQSNEIRKQQKSSRGELSKPKPTNSNCRTNDSPRAIFLGRFAWL